MQGFCETDGQHYLYMSSACRFRCGLCDQRESSTFTVPTPNMPATTEGTLTSQHLASTSLAVPEGPTTSLTTTDRGQGLGTSCFDNQPEQCLACSDIANQVVHTIGLQLCSAGFGAGFVKMLVAGEI